MSHVYEKAEYTAAYGAFLRYPNGIRLANYKGPEFPGTLEGILPPVTVRLHYHPLTQRPAASQRADSILSSYPITNTDKVIVFGCGFGWLCEALIAKTGCVCTGLEPSQYVAANKGLSADDELIESIVASGLDHTSGHGLKIFTDFSDPAPRTSADIDQREVKEIKDRRDLKKDRGEYNTVITEEVWQLLTAQEQADYTDAFNFLGATRIIHVVDGVVI
jgi:hypothetical protein